MAANHTAVIQQHGEWWIGWMEEVPGVNSNDELAEGLREEIAEGCKISVRILEVTGGDRNRKPTFGVNIEIRLESGENVLSSVGGTRTQAQRAATGAGRLANHFGLSFSFRPQRSARSPGSSPRSGAWPAVSPIDF